MSDKYIIKNCPACYDYDGKFGCEDNHDEQGRDTYCECITDCVMKQIVELCRHYKKHSDCGRECSSFGMFLSKLLGKLDIEEVE